MLPEDVARAALLLLPRWDRGAAAAACRAWRSLLAPHVTELRAAPLSELPRLMARFPAATSASVADLGPGVNFSAARVASALLACPRPLQELSLGATHLFGAAGLVAMAGPTARGAAWGARLTALQLNLQFVMSLPRELGAALPRLRELSLSNFRSGGNGLAAVGGCAALRALRFECVYCSELPQLSQLARLTRLEVNGGYNLRAAPRRMGSLKVGALQFDAKHCMQACMQSVHASCMPP